MIIEDGAVVGAPMATEMIIALAVGIPVGLCLIGLAIYCWRKQQQKMLEDIWDLDSDDPDYDMKMRQSIKKVKSMKKSGKSSTSGKSS